MLSLYSGSRRILCTFNEGETIEQGAGADNNTPADPVGSARMNREKAEQMEQQVMEQQEKADAIVKAKEATNTAKSASDQAFASKSNTTRGRDTHAAAAIAHQDAAKAYGAVAGHERQDLNTRAKAMKMKTQHADMAKKHVAMSQQGSFSMGRVAMNSVQRAVTEVTITNYGTSDGVKKAWLSRGAGVTGGQDAVRIASRQASDASNAADDATDRAFHPLLFKPQTEAEGSMARERAASLHEQAAEAHRRAYEMDPSVAHHRGKMEDHIAAARNIRAGVDPSRGVISTLPLSHQIPPKYPIMAGDDKTTSSKVVNTGSRGVCVNVWSDAARQAAIAARKANAHGPQAKTPSGGGRGGKSGANAPQKGMGGKPIAGSPAAAESDSSDDLHSLADAVHEHMAAAHGHMAEAHGHAAAAEGQKAQKSVKAIHKLKAEEHDQMAGKLEERSKALKKANGGKHTSKSRALAVQAEGHKALAEKSRAKAESWYNPKGIAKVAAGSVLGSGALSIISEATKGTIADKVADKAKDKLGLGEKKEGEGEKVASDDKKSEALETNSAGRFTYRTGGNRRVMATINMQ